MIEIIVPPSIFSCGRIEGNDPCLIPCIGRVLLRIALEVVVEILYELKLVLFQVFTRQLTLRFLKV